MSTDNVQLLLSRRREQWHRFHQLRGISPLEAAEARALAINAELQLSSQGFHGLK
ncbi:MAG TPA: hypothetical protein ACFE0H_14730 [Elainellaceae cyanobacterium]